VSETQIGAGKIFCFRQPDPVHGLFVVARKERGMMNRLRDKVAIVTGGASGIGRSLCLRLSRFGAAVVIADLNPERASCVLKEIKNEGGSGCMLVTDVSQKDHVQHLVTETINQYGRIDYMFNNAGVEINGELLSVESRRWVRGLEVNLHSVIYGTTAVYPVMIEQRAGHIVNVASLAGLVPFPRLSCYAATKHAVAGFTLSMRAEALKSGVKVNLVCPALVETDIRRNTASILGKAPAEYPDILRMRRITADTCARDILRGVFKNQAVITIPRYARFLWFVYRFTPVFYTKVVALLFSLQTEQSLHGGTI
jgi:NAD(P)-dependent dehydrogenase (short-subunit alcohol dehydrogenase family)